MIKVGLTIQLFSLIFKLIAGISGVAAGWYLFDAIMYNNWKIPGTFLLIALISILLKVTSKMIAKKILKH